MKKLALGAAAAAAILAPAVAHADTNAVAGLEYAHLDSDIGGDANAYGLNGAFNHDFSNGWELQMDGAVDRMDASGCCTSASYAAAHFGMRNEQSSFAGFVGLQDLSIFSGIALGIEGQWNFDNASLGGSVSYVDFGDIDANATHVAANGVYFFTPNFSVNAGVGYVNSDGAFFGDEDYWTYNIGGEYRFDNSPASVSLGWRHLDLDSNNVDAITVGLTLDLGTGDLHSRRTHGPSWDGARSMYDDLTGI